MFVCHKRLLLLFYTQAINKDYEEVPWYWYFGLLVLAFFAGECSRSSHHATQDLELIHDRLDCCTQGPDNSPVVGVHHLSSPRR